MTWRVGMKVVFVGDKPGALPTYRNNCQRQGGIMPAYGEVYTIRSMFRDVFGTELVRLVEINNTVRTVEGVEPGYPARCFRPVVERKTDISELTAILNGKRIQLPDLVEVEARSGLADRFVGTVGVLAGAWLICTAVMLAEFWGAV